MCGEGIAVQMITKLLSFFRRRRQALLKKICAHRHKGVNLRLHPWEPSDVREGWWAFCVDCEEQLYWASPKPTGPGGDLETQLNAIRAIGGNV